jgi:hypothetical protein
MNSARRVVASAVSVVLIAARARAETPKEALLAAVAAEGAAQHKRIVIQMTWDGKDVVQNWDIEAPDRFLFRQRSQAADLELYVIGRTVYGREPGGWRQAALGPASPPAGTVDWVNRAFDNTLGEVSLVGTESVSGQSAKRYAAQVHYRDQVGAFVGRADLWVSTASSLPVRATFSGTYGDRPFKADKTVVYEPSLTLDPPLPIVNP